MTYKVFLWNSKASQDVFIEIVFNIQTTGPHDTSGYLYFYEAIGMEQTGKYWHTIAYYEENYKGDDLKDKFEFKGVFTELEVAIARSWDLLRIIKGSKINDST
jgi:hypothetical protein